MRRRWKLRGALLAMAAIAVGTAVFHRANVAEAAPREPVAVVASITPPAPNPDSPVIPPRSLAGNEILIPVVGVEKSDLRDTWGASRGSRRHTAIDIIAPRGTPVVAVVDGTVLKFFTSKAGGLTMYLAEPAGDVLYYYAHLDRYAPGLAEGDVVSRGTILGYVGSTGNAPPNAPHLHFGYERLPAGGEWWKGKPENPYPILMQRGVTIPR
ncbi:MAG TPA: M23 family metallopeptidase [Thermoanaerobaculia bacterium]|nr:M23 family metallopeptidase [Thermoanaerobaculia bacterium]